MPSKRQAPKRFEVPIDADGRVLDFHGTWHTYISGIVASGASVKTCQ